MATRGLPTWPWAADLADDLPEPERLLLEAGRLWGAAGPWKRALARADEVEKGDARDAPRTRLPRSRDFH